MERVIRVATLASLTYKAVKWAAQYTSIFATHSRYNAVMSSLNYWDTYFQNMTPQEIAQFNQEQGIGSAYETMKWRIESLKRDAAFIAVELQRHSVVTRCNPTSNVVQLAGNWDMRCNAQIQDLERTTENLRRQQQQLQLAENEANLIRAGLDSLRNQVSNATLQGVISTLRVVVHRPEPERSAV